MSDAVIESTKVDDFRVISLADYSAARIPVSMI